MAPEYRRCALYAVAGAIVIGAVGFWARGLMNGGWLDRLVPAIMFALVAIAVCVLVFPWRLRLDSQGIARRRSWKWDHWPWEAFQDGTVRNGRGLYCYEWPGRRPWSRTLSYALLADRDRDFVHQVCNRFWVPPPEPDVPEELALKVPFRRHLRLTAEGIYCRGYGPTPFYRWDQLDSVVIVRLEHVRRDFDQAEIVAGDRTITLQFHQGRPVWTGPEPEVIAACLRRNVPAERLLIVAPPDRPRSLAEIKYREDAARRKLRHLTWFTRVILLVIGGFALAVVLIYPPARAAFYLLILTVQGGVPLALLRKIQNAVKQEQDELARSRAELEGQQTTPV